jgi:hypothetical protein
LEQKNRKEGAMSGDWLMRRHANVPTECPLCRTADCSVVVEVAYGGQSRTLLHWVSPPNGWFLLREARPRFGSTALIVARCPGCMHELAAIGS